MSAEQSPRANSSRKRVLILGGGFGGVYTALALEKLRGGRDDFDITLVNRENYFVYQPMLAEIISGSIGLFDTVSPLRRLLKKTDIQVRTIEAVDLRNRVVTTSPGFRRVPHQIPYDHLVLTLGNVTDFRGMIGLPEHALSFKNLGDALHIRNQVIHVLEEAAIETNPALKQALLTFVIGGAGYAGVECAGELNDFVRRAARTYRSIDPKEIRVVLVEFMGRILPGIGDGLQVLAQNVLKNRQVELRLNTKITAATSDAVIVQERRGEEWVDIPPIATKTLISTVPSSPNPITDALPLPKGGRGQIKVDLRMQVESSDHLWAVGDGALIPDPAGPAPDGKPRFCPPNAQYAVREAEIAAHNIVAAIRGGAPKEFTFRGLGSMGALGHRSAVAEVMGMRFSGLLAWLMWRGLYLVKLPGWDRQLRTGLAWLVDLILPKEIVQLKVDRGQGVVQEHYEPGQVVFEQDDVGDRLYIIVKGRCEVVQTVNGTEQKLAELGPGEYFGEMALLNQAARGATVRVTEALDVLSVPKPEFSALITHLPALQESFQQVMAQRKGSGQ